MSKLYVLVRRDLSKSAQAVQACHAVASWMLKFKEWENETLVLLGVKDLKNLEAWSREITPALDYAVFCEPDLEHEMTAIACHGHDAESLFQEIPLL